MSWKKDSGYIGSPASAQTLAVFQHTNQNHNYPILLSLHDTPSALGILGHVMQYFMYCRDFQYSGHKYRLMLWGKCLESFVCNRSECLVIAVCVDVCACSGYGSSCLLELHTVLDVQPVTMLD